jgi:ribosomal-protein-alanine N-acetyltransferase
VVGETRGSDAILPAEIRTARLLLRSHSFDDVEDVLSQASDAEWARYLPLPSPYLRAHAEEFLARQVLLDRAVHASWAIAHQGAYVGGINIRFQHPNRVGELGYSTIRSVWGKGFATEAVVAVVDAAFSTFGELNRVRAMADVRNLASQRVLVKAGFTREGTLRQNHVVRGEPIDEAWFGLLRVEWRSPRDA